MTVKIDIEDIGDAVQYHLDHPETSVAGYISACILFRKRLARLIEDNQNLKLALVNYISCGEKFVNLGDYWI